MRRIVGDKEYWTQRGVIPRWRSTLVYFVIIGAAILGVWQSNHLASSIQKNREELVYDQCIRQNQRHDAIVKTLFQLNPEASKRARAVEKFALAIAPTRDCDKVVEAVRVKTP